MSDARVPHDPDTPGDEAPEPARGNKGVRLSWTRQRMTQWFDPAQLARTGIRALLSGIFGAYADQREVQAALSHGAAPAIDDCSGGDELWIDYAADLGDGFDSTYTIAWLLGQAALPPPPEDATPAEKARGALLADTQRGQVLVLGGDQVYPTASRIQYENRFTGPFEAALPWVDEAARPRLFAIPGNHDWYDGLTSFMRLFCQQRSIGGWTTRQTRSYFAVQLPHRWWLLGIDIQLAADVDLPQMDYFMRVAEQMQPGDQVILCTAQPAWVEGGDDSDSYRNLVFFERKILCPRQARLMVTLTGDLHHYARYADSTGSRHKITAGGGGAYLYGTQCLPDAIELTKADPAEAGEGATPQSKTYTRKAEYPWTPVSRRLRLGALLLGFRNPGFVLFLGLLYILCGWLLQSAAQGALLLHSTRESGPSLNALMVWLGTQPPGHALQVFAAMLEITLQVPGLVVIAAVVVFGLYKFCAPDPGRPRWLRGIGVLHGLAHLVLVMLLTWLFAHWNMRLQWPESAHGQLWMQGTLYVVEMLVVGGPLGALLFSLALLPGVNFNEAYSAQHIEHYKNFVRLHIGKDGALTVYPVGVDRVARWEIDPQAGPRDPRFRTRNGAPPRPRLIEDPFTVPAPVVAADVPQHAPQPEAQPWNISTQ